MKNLKTISGELKIFSRLKGVNVFDPFATRLNDFGDQLERTLNQKDKLSLVDRQRAMKNLTERGEILKQLVASVGESALNESDRLQSFIKRESAPTSQDMFLAPLLAGKSTDDLMKIESKSVQKLLLSDAGELLGLSDGHKNSLQRKLFPSEYSQIETLNEIAKTSLQVSKDMDRVVKQGTARLALTQQEQALIDDGTL